MADASLQSKLDGLTGNTLAKLEITTELDAAKVTLITDALKGNTSCEEVVLANTSVDDDGAKLFAAVLTANSTLKKLDLGYNKIRHDGIVAIAEAMKTNASLTEIKLHRQDKDMGRAAEEILTSMWQTNTTLTRCYVTLHDRKFNGDNTRGEVRNKEIERRKAAGKDFLDLDPNRKEEFLAQQEEARKKAAEEEALNNAPISAKIESTGGPYTYKQLTSDREFWPDDVEIGKRESYLADDEFAEVFGMDKDAFGKLAGWKRNGLKKDKKLN